LVARRIHERGRRLAGLTGVVVVVPGHDQFVGGVHEGAIEGQIDRRHRLQRRHVVAVEAGSVADPHRTVDGEVAVRRGPDVGFRQRGGDLVRGGVDGLVRVSRPDPHAPVGRCSLRGSIPTSTVARTSPVSGSTRTTLSPAF
jgi:hypothetical protein